jgi:uncharacterized protein YdcH (DUF465 family)
VAKSKSIEKLIDQIRCFEAQRVALKQRLEDLHDLSDREVWTMKRRKLWIKDELVRLNAELRDAQNLLADAEVVKFPKSSGGNPRGLESATEASASPSAVVL